MTLRGYAVSRSVEPRRAARLNGQLGRRLKQGRNRVQAQARRGTRREVVIYKTLSLGTGILGGTVAGAIVNRVWGQFSARNEMPDPTALDLRLRKALVAGAVQGLIFGVVRTALTRATARGYRRLTGSDLKP